LVVIKAFLKIRSQDWALLGLFAVRLLENKRKNRKTTLSLCLRCLSDPALWLEE